MRLLAWWWGAILQWRALRRIPARTRVLHALAAEQRYAIETWQRYRVGPETFYPVVMKLERDGLVVGCWYAAPEGQPARKGYRLSHRGLQLHSSLVNSADWQRLDTLVGR